MENQMVPAIPFEKHRKHRLWFDAMQFVYSFQFVQLIWIVAGRSLASHAGVFRGARLSSLRGGMKEELP